LSALGVSNADIGLLETRGIPQDSTEPRASCKVEEFQAVHQLAT